MNYEKDEIEECWAKIQKHVKTITNELIKLRRTDNNGKIAQNATSNLIGKWAIANTNEKGNGENNYKTLEANDISCANAFFIPPWEQNTKLATWAITMGRKTNKLTSSQSIKNKN